MYNKKAKVWESGQYPEEILNWCREGVNKDNPQALFVQADILLSQASKGKRTADAVYLMEQAAKMGDPQAALAMGQMFQYGWAVGRSRKNAVNWYMKAAELGSQEAKEIIDALRRQKKRRILFSSIAVAATVCVALGVLFLLPNLLPVPGVQVGNNTTLLEPTTQEEFVLALSDLMEQYDTELVIAGEQSTNRLLLKFEGSGLDISRFPAATVIADEENYVVIQFESEEEAKKCLDSLKKMSGILFVAMDEYTIFADNSLPPEAFSSSGIPYFSPSSGDIYYSWGVEYLGLDQLAAWLQTQQTVPVIVAVLDTGTEPCDETQSNILSGVSITHPERGNGWDDQKGHGTHVAGTILDCTWGLDVTILPVQTILDNGRTSDMLLVEALRYAIRNGADVINMSLGGPCNDTTGQEGCGSAIDYYIQEAIANGIVVVVSAGNGDEHGTPLDTKAICPAHIKDCIVVSACGSDGAIASFSNFGDSVDVCAPGVDILSYLPGDNLGTGSGTSMAAPHISALAAMLKLYLPDKTPAQIEKYIKDYCVQMGDSSYFGDGIPWAGYFAGD